MIERKLIDEIKRLTKQKDVVEGFFNGSIFIADDKTEYTNLILTTYDPGQAFIVKYQDRWLCIVSANNEIIRTNIIVDRRSRYIENIVKNKGLIIWRDINWLIGGEGSSITSEQNNLNKLLFHSLIKIFMRDNKIYTIINDDRVYRDVYMGGLIADGLYEALPVPTEIFVENNIEVIPVDLNERNAYKNIDSVFFLPLLNRLNFNMSDIEKSNLKKIVKNNGLLCCSEHVGWKNYTNYLLNIFNLDNRIRTNNSYEGVSWKRNNTKLTNYGYPDSCGVFTGVKSKEILMSIKEEIGVFINDDTAEIIESAVPPNTPTMIYVTDIN